MPKILVNLAVLLIASSIGIPSVLAAPSGSIKFKYMAFLTGDCVTTRKDDQDLYPACKRWHATNTFYQNNAIAFGFVCNEGGVSFLGWKDDRPSSEKYTLQISTISISHKLSLSSAPATGTCTVHGDMMKEEATLTCDAATTKTKERYSFVLKSKGEPSILFTPGFEPTDIKANTKYAIKHFDIIYNESGIDGVRKHIETCYPEAQKTEWLPAVIACMVVDYAGTLVNIMDSERLKKPLDPFFMTAAADKRAKEQFEEFAKGDAEGLGKMVEVIPNLKNLTAHMFVSHSKVAIGTRTPSPAPPAPSQDTAAE